MKWENLTNCGKEETENIVTRRARLSLRLKSVENLSKEGENPITPGRRRHR